VPGVQGAAMMGQVVEPAVGVEVEVVIEVGVGAEDWEGAGWRGVVEFSEEPAASVTQCWSN
jgi:hypothetical protein